MEPTGEIDIMDDSYSFYYTAMPELVRTEKIRILLLAMMIITSTIGNIVTIIICLHLRQRRKSTVVLLIIHLAFADLMVTYFHMLPHLIWYSTTAWYWGDFMCKIIKFFSSFGLFCSSFMTVNISLDHALNVFNPLGKRHRPQRVKLMIASSYTFAFVFSLPQIVFFRVVNMGSKGFSFPFYQCVLNYDLVSERHSSIYSMFVLFIQVLIPLVIMCVAYVGIFLKIRHEALKNTSCMENPQSMRNARKRLFFRAQTRTLRMIVTIFVVFVINWSPYLIFTIWYTILPASETADQQNIITFASIFGLSNSCFNPIVYGVCNLHYCDSKCWCCMRLAAAKSDNEYGNDRKTSMFTLRWTRNNNRYNAHSNQGQKRVNFYDRSTQFKNSYSKTPSGNLQSSQLV